MRRRRMNEDLQAQRESQRDLYREIEPLIPIAQALQEEIDRSITGEESTGFFSADEAFDNALRKVAEDIITHKLANIDPYKVLSLYAERVSDAELINRLGEWAASRAEQIEKLNQLAALKCEVMRIGGLKLPSLQPDSMLNIGMFEPMNIRDAHAESPIPTSRNISLRLLEPESGFSEVISDTFLPTADLETTRLTHTRCFIGSGFIEDDDLLIEPIINLRAPLAIKTNKDVKVTEQIVGYIETGDGLILSGV